MIAVVPGVAVVAGVADGVAVVAVCSMCYLSLSVYVCFHTLDPS